MSDQRAREWKGGCTISMNTGWSFAGEAEVHEVAFDEEFTPWFGRVKLPTGQDFVKMPLVVVVGIRLADGRGGPIVITHKVVSRNAGDLQLPNRVTLPPESSLPLPSSGTRNFFYFAGISKKLEKQP